MPTRPHAGKSDYRDAFAGLVFPTSKTAILNKCRDQGGLDREVHAMLEQLPKSSYRSLEELQAAVRGVYLAYGVASDALPL